MVNGRVDVLLGWWVGGCLSKRVGAGWVGWQLGRWVGGLVGWEGGAVVGAGRKLGDVGGGGGIEERRIWEEEIEWKQRDPSDR